MAGPLKARYTAEANLSVLPVVWTSRTGLFTLRKTGENGRVLVCECSAHDNVPHLVEEDEWHAGLVRSVLQLLAESLSRRSP